MKLIEGTAGLDSAGQWNSVKDYAHAMARRSTWPRGAGPAAEPRRASRAQEFLAARPERAVKERAGAFAPALIFSVRGERGYRFSIGSSFTLFMLFGFFAMRYSTAFSSWTSLPAFSMSGGLGTRMSG
jgi:hypothetical protein